MALNLPQRRALREIQLAKRQIPVDQIIAIQGQSPVATGIDAASQVLGDALSQRAKLKQQAAQLAKLESLSGQEAGAYAGLDPQTAASFTGSMIKQKAEAATNNYTPDQVSAIASGDPNRLAAAFPNGVPNQAVTAVGSAATRDAMEAERAARSQERAAAAAAALEERSRREEERNENRLNSSVQEYAGMLEKTNIPSAISVADDVIRLIPESGQNIPGFGPVASKVPTLLVGAEGQRMRQAVGKMMNIELKDRSGVALRDEEIERLKQEFGSGSWNTEQQLRDGVVSYVNRLREIANNVVSSASPEAVSEYQKRGGRDIRGTFTSLANTARTKALKPIVPIQKSAPGQTRFGRFTVEEVR